MNKKLAKDILDTGIYLLVVFLAVYLIITYVGQRTVVNGSSMEPMLSNGDNLIVDKISYHLGDPQRFDIVVFPPRNAGGALYIKRVIALPGETIHIDEDGFIYINGELLMDRYGKEVIEESRRGRAAEEVTLGENEYFVMGDNRNNSEDSRSNFVGNVKRDEIIGRAWVRIWPLSDMGRVAPKR